MAVLDVAPGDPRHALAALARAWRRQAPGEGGGRSAGLPPAFRMVVWEPSPEVLARHLLLLRVALDTGLPTRERAERFLELHGNALLTERAEEYLEEQAIALEAFVSDYDPRAPIPADEPLARVADLRTLKYAERDALAEVFRNWRRTNRIDMAALRRTRLQRFYRDRYDFRRNMVDWDYHMRLQEAGVDGVSRESAAGHFIHFQHFREWRETGLAFEVGDRAYVVPNRTLASTVRGRAKEFKDRDMQDRGRSVQAYGYWGDIVNSPYHSFGTQFLDAEDRDHFLRLRNKQFVHNSVDLSQHNVETLLHELVHQEERSKPYAAGGSGADAPPAAGDLATVEELDENDDEQGREGEGAAEEEEERGKGGCGEGGLPEDLGGMLCFVTGDLKAALKKQKTVFDFVAVSNRYATIVKEDMEDWVREGTRLVVENAKYMVELKAEHAKGFLEKVEEMAAGTWVREREPPLPSSQMLFRHL